MSRTTGGESGGEYSARVPTPPLPPAPVPLAPATAIGAADLRRLLDEPEGVGVFAGRPLVAVRLDGDADLGSLLHRLAGVPAVTVGVAPAGDLATVAGTPAVGGLDVLLTESSLTETSGPPAPWVSCADVADAVAVLSGRAAANPTAAVALVQLLRLSARLDVAEGLVAESFVYGLLQAGAEHRRWLARQSARRRRSARSQDRAVRLERHGAVLEVELHRPEVRNAFNARMRDELAAAFELAAADATLGEVRVTGAGPSFCSGGDLDEFGTTTDPSVAHLVRTTRSAARSMLPCADRVVFAVHGACVGAGLELAALAGRVEADRGTTFVLPEVAMGLVPGACGTATLTRRIGRHRTAYLALSGLPVDAGTAARWGLVDEVTAVAGTGGRPPGSAT